jgi:amidophosphoribosyltransferase
MKKLVTKLRELGALKVHVLVTFPPMLHPCIYGIDIPSSDELLAAQCQGNIDKIRESIGADSLNHLNEVTIRRVLAPLGPLCMACVNGRYLGTALSETAMAPDALTELRSSDLEGCASPRQA